MNNMSEFEEKLRQHGKRAREHIISPFDIESEDLTMTQKNKAIKGTLCIAAAAAVILGTTVFAAYHLMTPAEIAERNEYHELAGILSEDDTKFDIPPQKCGDYTIEILGMTTGKNLSHFTEDFGNNDRSYIIGAVFRNDEKPISDYLEMQLTPLISGYKPWEVNIWTLGGGKSEFMENGVVYFVYECDGIEIFADHTVYIAVYDEGLAPGTDIFTMEDDGSIHFADSYKGNGAIFTLPLDKSKADPEKAAEYLKSISLYSDNKENTGDTQEDSEVIFEVDENTEVTAENAENTDVIIKQVNK